jgi:hypothetical protein
VRSLGTEEHGEIGVGEMMAHYMCDHHHQLLNTRIMSVWYRTLDLAEICMINIVIQTRHAGMRSLGFLWVETLIVVCRPCRVPRFRS